MASASVLSRKNWTRCPKLVLCVPDGDMQGWKCISCCRMPVPFVILSFVLVAPRKASLIPAPESLRWGVAQSPVGGCSRWKSTRRAWGSVHQRDTHASADLAYGLMPMISHLNPLYAMGILAVPITRRAIGLSWYTFSISILVMKK